MNNRTTDHAQIVRLCRGNTEALEWIEIGRRYVHEIDDLIDEDVPRGDRRAAAERACRIGALAIQLYSHPFFLKHGAALSQAMLTNTNNYADSVRWEESGTKWQREFSDWARHGWLDVALLVAYICGGYENMRNESAELRAVSYSDHHDDGGKGH
jgi:hypothetical protein